MRLEPAPTVYGMDFGMSTSSLTVLDEGGAFNLVPDRALRVGSRHSVPTAVYFDEPSGRLLVGGEAVNLKSQREDAYKDNFKRDVIVGPDSYPLTYTLANQSFQVTDLVAAVLCFLRTGAQEIDPRNPTATMLTVPVGWAAGRRRLMIDAAVAAGFPADSLYLIEEPVAAIEYARSVGMAGDDETVLVYDLGGGTFDCAVSTPANSGQRSIRRTGARSFGGLDFDYEILREIGRRFPDETSAVLSDNGLPGEPWHRLRLLESCESLKIRLSENEAVSEPLTELGPNVTVRITRGEFEGLIRSKITETIQCCQKMLSEIGLTWDDVDAVIPVGGSSRIPLIERELHALAPGRVRATADRDTAVARGAALLARQKAIRIAAATPPRAQELAPPAMWVPQAVPSKPAMVGIRQEDRQDKKFRRSLLLWTWVTLAPAAVAGVGLSVSHWRWLGASAVTILALLAVSGAVQLTAKAKKSTGTAGLIGTATVGMSLILLIIGCIYGYRIIFEHRSGYGLVCWWALASGVGAFACMVVQSVVSEEITSVEHFQNSVSAADADRRVMARISERRWFGPADNPPEFMAPLFALPALYGFELSPDGGTATFNYALVAGSRMLLIAMLAAADNRPDLDAAAASWRGRLGGADVTVKTILVVHGYELPVLRSDEQFGMTALMTTTSAFVDTVGHWIEQDNRIVLPTIRTLLGGN